MRASSSPSPLKTYDSDQSRNLWICWIRAIDERCGVSYFVVTCHGPYDVLLYHVKFITEFSVRWLLLINLKVYIQPISQSTYRTAACDSIWPCRRTSGIIYTNGEKLSQRIKYSSNSRSSMVGSIENIIPIVFKYLWMGLIKEEVYCVVNS